MRTYQDLLEVVDNEKNLIDFIYGAIAEYKNSDMYKFAKLGYMYDRQENETIMKYRKMLHTLSGGQIPDCFSANHKLPSNFYHRFNVQENQYLLGNGVTFIDEDLKDQLGKGKYAFDTRLQKLGKIALTQACGYGFWNLNHLDIFEPTEFAPLYDEEDGSMKAGIRWWQIAETKPLRVTLYEMDGYTEYIRKRTDETLVVYKPKRAYKLKVRVSEADGEEIYDGENYPGFPIIPLWGNQDHICNIKAWREKIDCYDLIESGFANDVDDASVIYWTIANSGGMDDVDLAEFIQRMKTIHAATVETDSGQSIESHTIDVPVTARETYLKLLEKDLYKDAMALDTEAIATGNTVATAIRAAYEPLNNKTDDFEYCVIEFIQGILALIDVEDDPTFKRSTIVNQQEETTMILAAAQYLDTETILKHLPFLSPDEIEDILDNLTREEADRFETDDGEEDNDIGGEIEGMGNDIIEMLDGLLEEE